MSLINEMLRDLEKRRKREERCVPCSETPVVVDETISSKIFFLAGGVLLLAGMTWLGIKIIPDMMTTKAAVPISFAQQEVVPAVVAEKVSSAIVIPTDVAESTLEADPHPAVSVPAQDTIPEVSEKLAAELLHLGVVEAEDSVQLSLTFAQLPEYRLLQNESGAAQLVVSFNQTMIGTDFEIPVLTGTLLKRVSLVPQKQTLQLLVDLGEHARVQSFQLLDDSDRRYRLLIEVVAVAPVAEKPQKQIAVPKSKLILAEKPKNTAPAKVSKNKNRLSRDQQAYQAGLEQLRQGSLIAAEASFNQALIINPKLQDARLQLVGLLQQQMKFAKAEEYLQQGLSLTPGNLDLRKIYARLLLHDRRQSEAIDLLKTKPVPSVVQDLEYHALLAAMYRESGQFNAASSIYAQLLQVRPQEALWWMGMAISLEQSGNSDPARDAYQKAVSLPGLSPDLQNYIHGRLQVL